MGGAALDHPPEPERASRPGTKCEACGETARRRVPVKKPGWRVPELRDLCVDCAREVEALAGQTPPPSAEERRHVRD
jgi:hypothetical protein